MCENMLTKEMYDSLNEYIAVMRNVEGSLISILHKAQEIFGYIPSEVQLHIARKLNMTAAKVNGVVTFYSYFTEVPKGKHVISICLGTACFVRGAENILKELEHNLGIKVGEVTSDGKFSIDALRCIGTCGLAPVIMVDSKVFGRLEKGQIADILKLY